MSALRRCGVCVAYRRVGGLHFLKLGRLTVSWSVSAAAGEFRAIGAKRPVEGGAA